MKSAWDFVAPYRPGRRMLPVFITEPSCLIARPVRSRARSWRIIMSRRVFLISLVVIFHSYRLCCLRQRLRRRSRRCARSPASPHSRRHGDAQSQIVGLGKNRHHRTPTANSNSTPSPLGEYSVSAASQGFAQTSQDVIVISGSVPVVHFQLQVATANENVTVSAAPAVIPTDSFTPITLVSGQDIERTPGADGTNSMAMITDYVPGAYVTHDMLHMRGGHQTTWLLDGIPIINTAIAQNLGPQFDPKDLDYVEVNRGSYGAEFGDRTYGVFNVVPRTGFERNNEAELVLTGGNFYQTDDQLSFGSHTSRFAYYASVNGNRSNLGLATARSPGRARCRQRRRRLRKPHLQCRSLQPAPPHHLLPPRLFPDPLRSQSQRHRERINLGTADRNTPSIGLRDDQTETDVGILFTWLHTFNSHLLTTVSPFYHYNSGDYASNPNDIPIATTENRASTYVGGQATFAANYKKNDLQVGFLSFYQSDSQTLRRHLQRRQRKPALHHQREPHRQSRNLLHR